MSLRPGVANTRCLRPPCEKGCDPMKSGGRLYLFRVDERDVPLSVKNQKQVARWRKRLPNIDLEPSMFQPEAITSQFIENGAPFVIWVANTNFAPLLRFWGWLCNTFPETRNKCIIH